MPGDEGALDRRSVLQTVGAAGATLAGAGVADAALARGPDVPLRVSVWYTADADRGHVEPAARDLADQLGVDARVQRRKTIDLDRGEFETFGELTRAFGEMADLRTGEHNVLVHYKKLPDEDIPLLGYDGCGRCNPNGGNLFDDYAGGGLSIGGYVADGTHRSMVNSAIHAVPGLTTDAYRNLIKHELLHGMLDAENSPQSAVERKKSGGWREHSYGTVFEPPWWAFWDSASASPMLTGYVEPVSNNVPHNADFDRVCGGGTPTRTYTHDPELSDCTRREARRWLREEYGAVGAAADAPTDLDTGLAARSIDPGESHDFVYQVDAASAHAVAVDGPEGADLDLLVTLDGRRPAADDFDRRSWGSGSEERIDVEAGSVDASTEVGVRVRSRRGGGEYTLAVWETG